MSAEDEALSLEFRNTVAALGNFTRQRLIDLLWHTFGTAQRRSAELWVTQAAVRRDFLSERIGALEYKMRKAFLEAFLFIAVEQGPQKLVKFPNDMERAGYKLRQYLANDYTRLSLTTVFLNASRLEITYEADSTTQSEAEDDAVDEWQDIPDETSNP